MSCAFLKIGFKKGTRSSAPRAGSQKANSLRENAMAQKNAELCFGGKPFRCIEVGLRPSLQLPGRAQNPEDVWPIASTNSKERVFPI
jgi:hypothetical protein